MIRGDAWAKPLGKGAFNNESVSRHGAMWYHLDTMKDSKALQRARIILAFMRSDGAEQFPTSRLGNQIDNAAPSCVSEAMLALKSLGLVEKRGRLHWVLTALGQNSAITV